MPTHLPNLRELRGAPQSALLAMRAARRPVSLRWLEIETGYSDKIVRNTLRYFRQQGLAAMASLYQGQPHPPPEDGPGPALLLETTLGPAASSAASSTAALASLPPGMLAWRYWIEYFYSAWKARRPE